MADPRPAVAARPRADDHLLQLCAAQKAKRFLQRLEQKGVVIAVAFESSAENEFIS